MEPSANTHQQFANCAKLAAPCVEPRQLVIAMILRRLGTSTALGTKSSLLPCQVCGYSLHVELAHIKPISSFSDETLLSVVNNPSNILVLCRNHHREQEHGFLLLRRPFLLVSLSGETRTPMTLFRRQVPDPVRLRRDCLRSQAAYSAVLSVRYIFDFQVIVIVFPMTISTKNE